MKLPLKLVGYYADLWDANDHAVDDDELNALWLTQEEREYLKDAIDYWWGAAGQIPPGAEAIVAKLDALTVRP